MTAPHPRSAPSGAGLRILRAAVFAAVCVALAAAGHGLASCAVVPLWTLGVGFLAVFAVAAALAGRERALPGIVAVLAIGQTALHTLFAVGQTGTAAGASMGAMASGAPVPDAAVVARAARLVCGTTAAAISPAHARKILDAARLTPGTGGTPAVRHAADALPAAGDTSMPLLPSLPMLLAHLLAAIAAGWVLRRGDLALLRLLHLSAQGVAERALMGSLRAALVLVRALRTGLRGAPEIARPRRTAPRALRTPRTAALQHTVVRRGPPSRALVLAA
ncbi:hypothetical protein ACGFS9_09545 [Streptomyces sp. NPDC048566]|uniref:hypothetical protein n=1 Tax=Streptomyces sp. NPDC048566 TaxID=3365569 RepID=UPI0037154F26